MTPSGRLISAKSCRGIEGGVTGAAVARVARLFLATATCGMKISEHKATTINRDFIFTPQAISQVAGSALFVFYKLPVLSLAVDSQASDWVIDGTSQAARFPAKGRPILRDGAGSGTGSSCRGTPRNLVVENTRLCSMIGF